ncbi:MAG TPA: hypothetical protein VJ734_06145 [Nitrosospira sp.]|nr:hypothetical protein [Nitrosospira sp.]
MEIQRAALLNGYQCPDQNQEQNIRRLPRSQDASTPRQKNCPHHGTGIKATNSDREHDNQEDYDERKSIAAAQTPPDASF